ELAHGLGVVFRKSSHVFVRGIAACGRRVRAPSAKLDGELVTRGQKFDGVEFVRQAVTGLAKAQQDVFAEAAADFWCGGHGRGQFFLWAATALSMPVSSTGLLAVPGGGSNPS